MSLECGKKPEDLEGTHTDTGRCMQTPQRMAPGGTCEEIVSHLNERELITI